MNEILTAARDALKKKLGGESLNGSVKFEIVEIGAIIIEGDMVEIGDREADCTLIATQEVFEDLLHGDINPTAAFMSGKLKVEGDMTVAMKLGGLLT